MAILLGVVTIRSIAWFGLITFVPLYEVSIGNSKGYGNTLLSLMLLSGVVGTLVAGPAADRFGRRPVVLVSNLVITPAIAVFLVAGGLAGAISLVVIGDGGRRDVQRDDGDEPGVHAAAHRHGLRALDRILDRARRHRGRHPRGARRLGRPRDGALGLRGRSARSAQR